MELNKIKHLHLGEKEWLKLNDYCKVITNSLAKKLPPDWPIDKDDISSTVFDAFLYLLSNYREGSLSPLSYCWQFAEKIALNILTKEYKRLKNEETLLDMMPPDEDKEGNVRH